MVPDSSPNTFIATEAARWHKKDFEARYSTRYLLPSWQGKRSVKGDAADNIDPMYVEDEEENLNDMHEMHRKNLSAVVFNYWVVEELKERNLMGKFLFGPYYLDKEKKHTVTFKDSVEIFLMKIDEFCIDETYEHIKCTGASFLLDL